MSIKTKGINHPALFGRNLDVTIEEAMETLNKYKIKFSGPIDRGYERSLYFNDPNEIKIELMSWITPLPVGADEADIISRAQIIRENEGAYNIEDKHVRQAMIELGFPQVT